MDDPSGDIDEPRRARNRDRPSGHGIYTAAIPRQLGESTQGTIAEADLNNSQTWVLARPHPA
ncbi:hypothetical protein FK535_07000 [Mycolicibacterium sp. 018/SC-01/001]|uniref:hypothetical protein n=1 Tax=Mycolicibacterium sp. 018/SC-01/001 TaxID=2592069 RepID=UPI00117D1683|nr:hypothetical protein [Mycolicibacterium sp. 018/SC-01/001]TRW86213.1 hypothetical protein FK535_07000 [Mycolicibacterium sp. 018/SC-01/001]